MSENIITIETKFCDAKKAKAVHESLSSSLSKNEFDLIRTLMNVSLISEMTKEYHHILDVEEINNESDSLKIIAVYNTNENPLWLIEIFNELGCDNGVIQLRYEDGPCEHYFFIGKERVNKSEYSKIILNINQTDLDELEDDDANILFLTQGQITKRAKIKSFYWDEDNYRSFCVIEMVLDSGETVFYKGTSSKMTYFAEKQYFEFIEFTARFEKGILNGKSVSFVRSPSKINAISTEPSSILDALKGGNKEFIDEKFGQLIAQYTVNLNSDLTALLLTIDSHSILGFEFSQLVSWIDQCSIKEFEALGHSVRISSKIRHIINFSSEGVGNEPIDHKSVKEHLFHQDIKPLVFEEYESSVKIVWENNGIDIALDIRPGYFDIKIQKFPDTSSWTLKQKISYYDDKPVLGARQWSELYEEALSEAKKHDNESMMILGSIYNRDREIGKYDPLKAIDWWEKSAAHGNINALLALGKSYTVWQKVHHDLEKGKSYLKRGTNLGCKKCAKALENAESRETKNIYQSEKKKTEITRNLLYNEICRNLWVLASFNFAASKKSLNDIRATISLNSTLGDIEKIAQERKLIITSVLISKWKGEPYLVVDTTTNKILPHSFYNNDELADYLSNRIYSTRQNGENISISLVSLSDQKIYKMTDNLDFHLVE